MRLDGTTEKLTQIGEIALIMMNFILGKRLGRSAVTTQRFTIVLWAAIIIAIPLMGAAKPAAPRRRAINSSQVWIKLSCGKDCLWEYGSKGGRAYKFAAPAFEVDGKQISAEVQDFVQVKPPVLLDNQVTEYSFEGTLVDDIDLHLGLQMQINDGSPVVRFRYVLRSDGPRRLGPSSGKDDLSYFTVSLAALSQVEEVEISNLAGMTHSYTLTENAIDEQSFGEMNAIMGPIVAATDGHHSLLLAYEHGSQVPDAFLRYQLSPDRRIRLAAVKANFVGGQSIKGSSAYKTIWLETGAVDGGIDELASSYRRFVLKYMTQNMETRKPYIFYNTWNFQERNRWWNGKDYLDSMNEDRILQEIDVAHKMGIDVFVLDTGWYEKTGDWRVSSKRFPDEMKAVKAKLDGYGMKLGLWFDPTAAAVSSRMATDHPEWRMSWNGKIPEPYEVWETEKSYSMCLVSGYADAFADELIRISKEVGVTYFKFDAVGQYGCNDPHHNHGTEANTLEERANSYAFQLVHSMSYIADKLAAAVPGAIIDFDVTEGGRAMGLGFLSSGKYFLINNGPYFQNYDVPIDQAHSNWNLFFYQGQARTWITRTPLTFDNWIPSILFLTHYFPDDPQEWQEEAVASLILGQNGIWGDLLKISDTGTAYIGRELARYKQVRDDITESDPVVSGLVSGSPEIHEKISSTSGRGAVAMFVTVPGTYEYFTKHKVVAEHSEREGIIVERKPEGNAKIIARFDKPGARVIFFGAN
jgi:alpha-galactosidase